MANPMYRQIAEDLREQIESGKLAPGSQLPAELDLRDRHNASRNTVRDAIKWLTNLGLVETRPGQGTFVVEDVGPFVTTLPGDPLTGLGGGEGATYRSQVSAKRRTPAHSPVQVERQRAGSEVAARLRIPEGTEVVSRHERRFIETRRTLSRPPSIRWNWFTTGPCIIARERSAARKPQEGNDG